jgi:phage-related tail protein
MTTPLWTIESTDSAGQPVQRQFSTTEEAAEYTGALTAQGVTYVATKHVTAATSAFFRETLADMEKTFGL